MLNFYKMFKKNFNNTKKTGTKNSFNMKIITLNNW